MSVESSLLIVKDTEQKIRFAILIDCGSEEDYIATQIIQMFEKEHILKIDYVLLTNFSSRNINGIITLLERS